MNFLRRLLDKTRPRDLIGPPDPISNIRPIICGNRLRTSGETHPYSLSEFHTEDEDDADMHWRIERDSLNWFNHNFWSDSNSRFMQEKQRVLAELQELPTDERLVIKQERAMSAFYSRWSAQESARQAIYTAEWNARNHAVIRLALRRQLRLWRSALRNSCMKY